MKACWKRLIARRKFVILVILALPVIMGPAECNPPPSNITCQPQVSFSLERGKCAIIYPPCSDYDPWQSGDIYRLSFDAEGGEGFGAVESFSNGTQLRRICVDVEVDTGNYQGGYQYFFDTANGQGNVTLSVFDEGLFSVGALTLSEYVQHTLSGKEISVHAYPRHGVPPYSITFTANGVSIPPSPNYPERARHHPTRNTEYKVMVTDNIGQVATDTNIVLVSDNLTQPRPSIAGTPSGTIPVNQPVTLTPTGGGAGAIVQWQWDFDWQGDDSEAFEQTINGSNGTTTSQWNTGGTKYIRVRATDAQGNFGEAFVSVRVQ